MKFVIVSTAAADGWERSIRANTVRARQPEPGKQGVAY